MSEQKTYTGPEALALMLEGEKVRRLEYHKRDEYWHFGSKGEIVDQDGSYQVLCCYREFWAANDWVIAE